MKKLFTGLILILCSYSAYSQITLPNIGYTPLSPNQSVTRNSYSLPSYSTLLPEISYERINTVVENGWYEASVKYYNSNTGTKSTYNLQVKIFNDRVTAISFGNEGSLHSGSNNSGYTYSGGDLTFYKNNIGEIVGAEAKVVINQNGSKTTFDIEL